MSDKPDTEPKLTIADILQEQWLNRPQMFREKEKDRSHELLH